MYACAHIHTHVRGVGTGGRQKGGRGSPEREGDEKREHAAGRGGVGGDSSARLRKEAASEQRGNKGLVSPLRCGHYIVARSTVDGAAQCKRRRIVAIKPGDRRVSGYGVRYRDGLPVAVTPARARTSTPLGFDRSISHARELCIN